MTIVKYRFSTFHSDIYECFEYYTCPSESRQYMNSLSSTSPSGDPTTIDVDLIVQFLSYLFLKLLRI